MESSLLCKIERNLKGKSEFKNIAFTEPHLVAYKESVYDDLRTANKIFYFKKPKPECYPIDLNLGFRTYTKNLCCFKTESSLKYTSIISEAKIIDENADTNIIKVFTRRGALIAIMEHLYPQQYEDNHIFHISRYNGCLYMVALRDNAIVNKRHHSHDAQFVKNVFTESINQEPNINKPFDANKALMGIYKSNLGEFEFTYTSPISGIQAENDIRDFDDIEALNNCRFVMAKQMWHASRNDPGKHLNYYLQAILTNVKDLYFAYKDNNGIIREPIIHKCVSDLSNEFKFCWKPENCFAFLYKFLKEVHKLMTDDKVNSFNTVYEFIIDRPSLTVSYKIFKNNPEMIVVPPEYVDYCQKKFGH